MLGTKNIFDRTTSIDKKLLASICWFGIIIIQQSWNRLYVNTQNYIIYRCGTLNKSPLTCRYTFLYVWAVWKILKFYLLSTSLDTFEISLLFAEKGTFSLLSKVVPFIFSFILVTGKKHKILSRKTRRETAGLLTDSKLPNTVSLGRKLSRTECHTELTVLLSTEKWRDHLFLLTSCRAISGSWFNIKTLYR